MTATEPDWLADVPARFLEALTKFNGPIPGPTRTLGPAVCRWIEANCVMGEGDRYKQPVRLLPFQRALIWKLFEIRDDGSRRFAFALIGLGKGAGKSPVAAWVGNADLAGPSVFCRDVECERCDGGWLPSGKPHAVRRSSPDVLVIAKSYEQADLIFGEMKVTFEEGPLKRFSKVGKGTIELTTDRGHARRVPATPGQTDGSKSTTLLVDEMHEFDTAVKENGYETAAAGTAKRQDGFVGVFSTAGHDMNTLFGREVARGKSGQFDDEELFLYMEAEPGLDPAKNEDIAEGIRQANPLAAAGVASVSRLVTKFKKMPRFMAKRYFWNQWVPTDESWLPDGAWDACKGELINDWSLPTWVGADMAKNRDSAAVVIVQKRPDGLLQASARIWFPDGNLIDQSECDDYMRSICATHNVQWCAADEAWWPTLTQLEKGDPANGVDPLPIFRMPQQGRNMTIAYTKTYALITDRLLVHGGQPDFSDQIASAAPKSTDSGWKLQKGKTKRRIDSAPALAAAIFASEQEREVVKPAPQFGVI